MSEQVKKLVPKLRFKEFHNTEAWAFLNGDKIFEPISNKNHNSDLPILAITQEHGAIPRELIDYKVIATEQSIEGYKVVEVGDFIISLRSFQGGIEYSNYKGICSPAYIILRNKIEVFDLFFKYYFKTELFIRDLNKNIEGIRDGKMVSFSQFSERLLPLPKFKEQQKIADCLSSLDNLITAQKQKVEALKQHKKGLMQQLFPAEGETVPKLRFPEFENDRDWQFKTLKEIAAISSGSTPLRSNEEFFVNGNIHWVKTTDLNNSFIAETEEKITPKAKARINPVGSILVAMYGGFNQIGRTGCLSVPAATNQAISVLVINQKLALPVYVLAWLNAKVEDWKRIASSSRKDPNITGSDVGNFPISFPSMLEQQRISDFLSSIEDLITTQSQQLEAYKSHKKGLMQQLFPALDDCNT